MDKSHKWKIYTTYFDIYYNPGEENIRETYKYYFDTFVPFLGKAVAIELSEYDGQTFRVSHRFPLKKRLF